MVSRNMSCLGQNPQCLKKWVNTLMSCWRHLELVKCPVTTVLCLVENKIFGKVCDMDSKTTNRHMGITKQNKTKNHRHLYLCSPSLLHLPPSHPVISESNNAVDLIGYWCHKCEAKIHGGPTSLIVFHFWKWPLSLPFLLAI